MEASSRHRPRITSQLRGEGEERVTPLELFFDLVFVLALTQCTALMADTPTWEGLARGILVLAVLWWSWVGYAWLTSVVNPEEGTVRYAIFGAMAGLLVVALCVPEAFGGSALVFAAAYAVVRAAQIVLFLVASRGGDERQRGLRKSVWGLAVSTAVAVGLLLLASATDGVPQGALWVAALAVDMGGPALFGSGGWKLEPGHFAERHGLIVIIALGESIVAIGVGAEHGIDAGVVAAAVLGVAVAAALWSLYFDLVALVAARRLENAGPGQEQNEIARDSFSFLHFPMIAGIVLLALGLKKTLGDTGAELKIVPAVALLGGTAVYLFAHVAFRWRNVHRLSTQRVIVALVLLAAIPLALEVPALASVAFVAVVLAALVAYEQVRFKDLRRRMRGELLLGAVSLSAAVMLVAAGPAAAKTVWLCKPGLKDDPCRTSLRTTVLDPRENPLRVESVERVRRPRIDCFYVYPTVSGQPTLGASKAIDPELRSSALWQAARYSEQCRVYAPVYRQVTLVGIQSSDRTTRGVRERAYGDVREAWRTYLRRHNRGRGVVLIGHSQGTFMLRKLIRREIDRRPKVRRRLISAYLLGGNVLVREGRDAGGDFRNIRACRRARQFGCVVAFSAFDHTPPPNAVFGRTPRRGMEVLCTNPAALGGGSAPLDFVVPATPFAPGTAIGVGIGIMAGTRPLPEPDTAWASLPGAFRARCSGAGGADVLRIEGVADARDLVPTPDATWGLHLADANIALGDLVELAARQAAAYRRARG